MRATAREASFDHDVLKSGMRPEARTANAQAAATRAPNPRPRYAAAVSSPASAALSERRAQKQTLTARPSSTNATIGVRPGISLAFQPEKLWSSNCTSSIKTMSNGGAISSGKMNAGPESTLPSTSDLYRSAFTGASRKPATAGSSRASRSSSSATSCGTSPRTAHAQVSVPLTRQNSGPSLGSGSRVAMMRPSPLSKNKVCRWRSDVLRRPASMSSETVLLNGQRKCQSAFVHSVDFDEVYDPSLDRSRQRCPISVL